MLQNYISIKLFIYEQPIHKQINYIDHNDVNLIGPLNLMNQCVTDANDDEIAVSTFHRVLEEQQQIVKIEKR